MREYADDTQSVRATGAGLGVCPGAEPRVAAEAEAWSSSIPVHTTASGPRSAPRPATVSVSTAASAAATAATAAVGTAGDTALRGVHPRQQHGDDQAQAHRQEDGAQEQEQEQEQGQVQTRGQDVVSEPDPWFLEQSRPGMPPPGRKSLRRASTAPS
jgi:hypothetical protein